MCRSDSTKTNEAGRMFVILQSSFSENGRVKVPLPRETNAMLVITVEVEVSSRAQTLHSLTMLLMETKISQHDYAFTGLLQRFHGAGFKVVSRTT